jgi:hypothetical protein
MIPLVLLRVSTQPAKSVSLYPANLAGPSPCLVVQVVQRRGASRGVGTPCMLAGSAGTSCIFPLNSKARKQKSCSVVRSANHSPIPLLRDLLAGVHLRRNSGELQHLVSEPLRDWAMSRHSGHSQNGDHHDRPFSLSPPPHLPRHHGSDHNIVTERVVEKSSSSLVLPTLKRTIVPSHEGKPPCCRPLGGDPLR